jgi:hypothetical protein
VGGFSRSGYLLGFAYRALSLNEEPHISSTTIFCGDSRSSLALFLYMKAMGNAAQQRHSPTNTALWRESSSIRCLLSTVQGASWNSWPMIPSKSPYVCTKPYLPFSPTLYVYSYVLEAFQTYPDLGRGR